MTIRSSMIYRSYSVGFWHVSACAVSATQMTAACSFWKSRSVIISTQKFIGAVSQPRTGAGDPMWPAVSLDACETVSTNASESFSTRKRLLPCSKPLDGALLSLSYVPGAPIRATLVRLSRLDGSTQNVLMPARRVSVQLPNRKSQVMSQPILCLWL